MRLRSVLRCMLTRSLHPVVLESFRSRKAKEAGRDRRYRTTSLRSFITLYINALKKRKNLHTGSFATSAPTQCPARNHPSSLLQATQEPPSLIFSIHSFPVCGNPSIWMCCICFRPNMNNEHLSPSSLGNGLCSEVGSLVMQS